MNYLRKAELLLDCKVDDYTKTKLLTTGSELKNFFTNRIQSGFFKYSSCF